MRGDYGYMEDEKLGKAYNFRLLKRLIVYGLPYKKKVLTALLLSLLLTLADLAVPYLSKIAIDCFIRSSWYRVDLTRFSAKAQRYAFLTRYGQYLKKTVDSGDAFIFHSDLNKIDPVVLHQYQKKNVILTESYYRTRSDFKAPHRAGPAEGGQVMRMADGTRMIPFERMTDLSKKEIMRIRADDLKGVMVVALLALALIAFSFALNYGEYYLLAFVGQHVMQDIRVGLFKKIQSNALRFFDRNPVGRLVTRVTNDIENLNEMFRSVVVTVFKDFFILSGILVIMLYLDWRLSFLCFFLIPFIFGFTLFLSSMARDAFRTLRESVAKINAFLQERIAGMRVIQLFVKEHLQMAAFSKINRENYKAGMKQVRVFAIFMPVMEFFSAFAVALMLWYGGLRVMDNQLSLGTLVAFIGYIQMFFKPIRDISEKYNIMQSAMASTERIFEFLDHQEAIPEPQKPRRPIPKKGHLVFKNVCFSYNQGQPVLRDVSFEVTPGETVAVVGATGAGKTTLVNLVERFYDPDQGAVLLDNVDLRKWPIRELRRTIGLCLQDVFIFSGNLEENITLGRPYITEPAIKRAAARANAQSFISRLENGFQQELGEGGVTLSAGQRQLLSFARALAADPPLLILDEATSSVDPETERLIQEAISHISSNRTTLVVAHRLSTIRNADLILVMHQGRIVEQGTHEKLMTLQGFYYKLNRFRESEGEGLRQKNRAKD